MKLDVIVVANIACGQKLQSYFTRIFDGGRVDLVLLEEYRGTIDALLAVKLKLKHDFLVLNCDLITDFPISRIVERCRMGDFLMTALLTMPMPMNFGQQPKESTREPDGPTKPATRRRQGFSH